MIIFQFLFWMNITFEYREVRSQKRQILCHLNGIFENDDGMKSYQSSTTVPNRCAAMASWPEKRGEI